MTGNGPVDVYSTPRVGQADPDPREIADLTFRSLAEIVADIRRSPHESACRLRGYVQGRRPQLGARAVAAADRP